MSPAGNAVDRDLRLDACRGIALWFIFLDHVPDNVCSWLTLRHYGFSDTTEIFMFVSGVTCALAYGAVQRCDGWWAVVSHTLRRGWEIYAADRARCVVAGRKRFHPLLASRFFVGLAAVLRGSLIQINAGRSPPITLW